MTQRETYNDTKTMIQTITLSGIDERLYRYVAPLVMNPDVIRANNNYPFKTTEEFTWFIATEGESVCGFVPVEKRGSEAIINNYYATDRHREEIFRKLLPEIISTFAGYYRLLSVTLIGDRDLFEKHGFVVVKEWRRYLKMTH